MQKIILKILGMHCQSCKTLLETEIKNVSGVKEVKVDFPSGRTEVKAEQTKKIISKIINKVKEHGYSAEVIDGEGRRDDSGVAANEDKKDDFEIRATKYILIGLGVIVLLAVYFILQKTGVLQIFGRLHESNLSFWLLFLIGFLASFHCVGMCGGLVVTYSAKYHVEKEKNKNNFLPHAAYNLGRVVSYTVIGAVLGGVGSFFGVNPMFSGIVTVLAAFVMVMMGLSLIKNISLIEKIKSKIPAPMARYFFSGEQKTKSRSPFFIGLLNGFMPCGPLQAVQLYALGTGSVLHGALSMFFYVVGTAPILFSFGSLVSAISGERVKRMMKFSGAVVILLGLFMLNRGLTNFGWGYTGFLPQDRFAKIQSEEESTKNLSEVQVVKMDLTYRGYVPNVLYVKRGVPVQWIINVKQISGCTNEILVEKLEIKRDLQLGENIIEFTPTEIGEIPFSCWMKMVWGKFVVTN
jgi:sulfite exporter TauE/SafE/copper chaperone CopZ